MIVAIASGKGGTGKTTVATNLALSLNGKVQLLDCDVEEPNAHLFLKPKFQGSESVGIPIPQVDEKLCTFCGKCGEICQYGAILAVKEKVLVFPELCHGCGGCSLVCPEAAISEVMREVGTVEKGVVRGVDFVHGRLNVGEPMAPPLIRAVKEKTNNQGTVIIDAPPGTSCPVIESIKGSDYVILVTEPTPFGLYDLTLAVDMVKALSIPSGVIINKADIGDKGVDQFCQRENLPVLLRIPLERRIAEVYSRGEMMVDIYPEYKEKFRSMISEVKRLVRE